MSKKRTKKTTPRRNTGWRTRDAGKQLPADLVASIGELAEHEKEQRRAEDAKVRREKAAEASRIAAALPFARMIIAWARTLALSEALKSLSFGVEVFHDQVGRTNRRLRVGRDGSVHVTHASYMGGGSTAYETARALSRESPELLAAICQHIQAGGPAKHVAENVARLRHRLRLPQYRAPE